MSGKGKYRRVRCTHGILDKVKTTYTGVGVRYEVNLMHLEQDNSCLHLEVGFEGKASLNSIVGYPSDISFVIDGV